MSIANLEKKTSYRRGIAKMLVGTAIGVGCFVGAAAPASADPNSYGADQNPFGNLSASTQVTAPSSGPAASEELSRGIRDGLAT